MIELEVFGESVAMARVAGVLDEIDGVSRVRRIDVTPAGSCVVSATVRPRAVDGLLATLRRLGVPEGEIKLTRVEIVAPAASAPAGVSLVWEDVLGQAWLNARPIARYLAFMLVAGVIGCYGVIDTNGILIVGAMAVAPDLLPITAIGVGVVGGRPRLAGRALVTVGLGMAVASAAAAAFAFAQDQLDLIPARFDLDATVLGTLTSVNDETLVVAAAAGIAGMLALETRASAAVGVAISVTTIPAAAYLGVAAGLGDAGRAGGAVAVLATNVIMMAVGASITLAVQRALARRAADRRSQGIAARSDAR
jgi:uncharacterized hydrophobic protein (TIGR00271 family)